MADDLNRKEDVLAVENAGLRELLTQAGIDAARLLAQAGIDATATEVRQKIAASACWRSCIIA